MSVIPVVIIGAGPVGLSASIALSRLGIRNLVIEKHRGTSIHPKARGVNVRTMELCRLWEIENEIRESELPVSAQRYLWMSCVKGEIQGAVTFTKDPEQQEISPTRPCILSQDILEQKLLASLEKEKHSQVHFNTRAINLVQQDQFVECELENLIDSTRTQIRCHYLIAADGANSFVREQLGINMNGIPILGTHVSVYCETDLSPWLSDKPFAVMSFTDKKQMGRIMMAVDLKQRWIFSRRLADANDTLTNEQAIELVRATVDEAELPVNVINISKWEMAAVNAEQYRCGRIFLCGDAAHRIPPTGGMGMNTGIGDAHNLAWKIAYVLHGHADESLLDSYEQERKPLAQTTMDWSVVNAQRMRAIFQALIDDNHDAFRAGLEDQSNHINHPGLDLGFIYQSNALFARDGEIQTYDPNTYQQQAIVGMRAPHCWLSYTNNRVSTIDLFEKNFVLLVGEKCVIENIQLPIPAQYPMTTFVIGKDLKILDQDFYSHYQIRKDQAVLVRPDGHIAWVS